MSLNCPLLNEHNKNLFNWNYATGIERIIKQHTLPGFVVFSNQSKCLYGWGHSDLVSIFTNETREEFNIVKDNDDGITKFVGWVHAENLGLRFIITQEKKSLKLYYLKTDEHQNHFKDRIRTITNPIYSFMGFKAEMTDYILNFKNNQGNLGDNIEKILDRFTLMINDKLKSNTKYREWKRPKLYKKGGLSIKKLWDNYSPDSMSPYLDQQTLLKLTSKNSDYDVTILFYDDLTSQSEYIKIMNDLFIFIRDSIRDDPEYRRVFINISNEIKRFGVPARIPINQLRNIYDNLPTGSLPIFNTSKDQVYIDIAESNRIKVKGYSCVNSNYRQKTKSFDDYWNRRWNEAWRGVSLPFEFSLNTFNFSYPYSDETNTCNPEKLGSFDTSFTLFRCLGVSNVVAGRTISNFNFEILDISCDSNYKKVNIESRLQNPIATDDDENIYMNFSTLLYDNYRMILDAETELNKPEKRCMRFNTMLTIYDKLMKDGVTVDVGFFNNDKDNKLKFIKNYLKFCRNMIPDTSFFNEIFIRDMTFLDFTQLSKSYIKGGMNLDLRKHISSSIKRMNENELRTNIGLIRDHFNVPVFLQGGVKLLVLLRFLSQNSFDLYGRMQNMVTPSDFDFFTFTEDEDDYPIDIIDQFKSCRFHGLQINSDDWGSLSDEQNEMIKIHNNVQSKQFSIDDGSSSDILKIYNHIQDQYYDDRNIKISRPYIVCAKTGFASCKIYRNKINEFNLFELNIVNLAWAKKIQQINSLRISGSQTLLLQAVYPYIHSVMNKQQSEQMEDEQPINIYEDYAFLLSSYMNYVYNLKPVNSLMRFLVASIYLIKKEEKRPEDLSNLFDDFRRSVEPNIGIIYNYYNKKRGRYIENYFNETSLIRIESHIYRDDLVGHVIPFNPFKKNYTDLTRIETDLKKLVDLVSLEKLAMDAGIADIRC